MEERDDGPYRTPVTLNGTPVTLTGMIDKAERWLATRTLDFTNDATRETVALVGSLRTARALEVLAERFARERFTRQDD